MMQMYQRPPSTTLFLKENARTLSVNYTRFLLKPVLKLAKIQSLDIGKHSFKTVPVLSIPPLGCLGEDYSRRCCTWTSMSIWPFTRAQSVSRSALILNSFSPALTQENTTSLLPLTATENTSASQRESKAECTQTGTRAESWWFFRPPLPCCSPLARLSYCPFSLNTTAGNLAD